MWVFVTAIFRQVKWISLAKSDVFLIIRGAFQAVFIVQGHRGRNGETALHFSFDIERGALEASVKVLVIDRLVVALGVFTALQHGVHDRNELLVQVPAVISMGWSLNELSVSF